jgi:chorismate mutase / prephenate dehydratase
MKIDEIRLKIDQLDAHILKLMNDRAELAVKIGKLKKENNIRPHAPDRELEIIRKIKSRNNGPLSGEAVKRIFREIMSACLALQKPPSVAYFGPEATFTHLAAMEKFGGSAVFVPVKSIGDVFREVEKTRCDYGVVPVENSIEGMVNYTIDMFVDSDLKICGEIALLINQHLLSKSAPEDIKILYSHPQAFAQCRLWIETNMPRCRLVEVGSTSEAAKMAASDKSAGAIAGMAASKMYNLPVKSANIEDAQGNMTRFLIVSKKHSERTGNDKSSVMFSVKDRIGALYDMLKPFKKHKINLTKIESRPSKKKAWDYFFFVDMKGHIEDRNVASALKEIEDNCVMFKFLGSYPEAEKNENSG